MESNLCPYEAVPHLPCRSALVFAPHPDDETLGCGGLLAALNAAAIPVEAVILTSGDFGEYGKEGVSTRENETRAAAARLGIDTLHFWREADRGIACDERTVGKAREAIITARADLLLMPSVHEIHPDHRATAWLVIEAARQLVSEGREVRIAMYEVGVPLQRVDALIDITPHMDTKREAIACYRSQLSIHPYDELILSLNRYRTYTLPAQVKLAEAYTILDAQVLLDPSLITESELHRQERLGLVTVPMPKALRTALRNKMEDAAP